MDLGLTDFRGAAQHQKVQTGLRKSHIWKNKHEMSTFGKHRINYVQKTYLLNKGHQKYWFIGKKPILQQKYKCNNTSLPTNSVIQNITFSNAES